MVELEWGLCHVGSDAIPKVRTELKWRTPVASQKSWLSATEVEMKNMKTEFGGSRRWLNFS